MKRRTNVWLARLGTYGWHARTTVLLPVLLVAYGLTGLLACWLELINYVQDETDRNKRLARLCPITLLLRMWDVHPIF